MFPVAPGGNKEGNPPEMSKGVFKQPEGSAESRNYNCPTKPFGGVVWFLTGSTEKDRSKRAGQLETGKPGKAEIRVKRVGGASEQVFGRIVGSGMDKDKV